MGGGGGGGVGGRGGMGTESSVPPAALPKLQSLAANGFHRKLFLCSTNFI